MKKIEVFTFCLLLFITSCSGNVINQVTAEKVDKTAARPKSEIKQETVNASANKRSIAETKGIIALSDKYSKNDFVRFYNEDGSLWYEFTFYYDDSDGKFEYANENFNPFAFHPDNFLLALKSTGEDGNRYEVVVNEETGWKQNEQLLIEFFYFA